MPISVKINEILFISYAGLIASGYELTDKNDTEIMNLVDDIRNTGFQDDIIKYFKKARTTNTINPYWPYGSDISAASFFIKDFAFNPFDDYAAFIKSTGFEGHDDWFWAWIKALPNVLGQITASPVYSRLWEKYQGILQSRISDYNRQIEAIESIIGSFTFKPYSIEFSPNPLQFISVHRNVFADFMPQINLDSCINTEYIAACGYMWDNSEGAKVHALEECFVRGISIGISNMSEQEKAQHCKWSRDSGFLFVSEILKVMKGMDITEDNLGEFIRHMLERRCSWRTDNPEWHYVYTNEDKI